MQKAIIVRRAGDCPVPRSPHLAAGGASNEIQFCFSRRWKLPPKFKTFTAATQPTFADAEIPRARHLGPGSYMDPYAPSVLSALDSREYSPPTNAIRGRKAPQGVLEQMTFGKSVGRTVSPLRPAIAITSRFSRRSRAEPASVQAESTGAA